MKKPSVYIETHGCQMNVADSERAQDGLRQHGFAISNDAHTADVVVINTCSVRAKAEDKVFSRVGEIRHARKKGEQPLVGITGCVAQLEGENLFERTGAINFVAGTRATDRLPNLIQRVMEGERRVSDFGERGTGETWNVTSTARRSKFQAFVPIIEGCNKFCSYCIVPYSRGREASRTAADIIWEIKRLIAEGYKEVQLIGQNVNSYRPKVEAGLEGFAGATPFSRLLRAVAATNIERVKFTTSFPRDFHPDIVQALDENPNLCNWIHLPVQSGSNRVLRQMRRGYTAEDYKRKIDIIRNANRRYSITTDMIIGFPDETEQEFAETLSLTEYCQFDGMYIFKYSERKGTRAANLQDSVTREIKTTRFKQLEDLQKTIQAKVYSSYVNTTLEVLTMGVSAKKRVDLTGHSTCQKVVNFACEEKMLGEIVRVRVTETKDNSLYGTFVQ